MDVGVVCGRLATIVDRLAHQSTDQIDIMQTVEGLRRICKTEMPSRILQIHADSRSTPVNRQINDLKQQIAQMRAEEISLEAEYALLKVKHAQVEKELQELREGHQPTNHQIPKDWYSYNEVMDIIFDKFGKLNGTQTHWAAYSLKLHTINPQSPLLTVSLLQSWRKDKKFPAWAVQQLRDMPVIEPPQQYKWSEEDIEFLVNLHLADPYKTDNQLAQECTLRFDRPVNSNSIKSKFNILRKMGRIPMLRPTKSPARPNQAA
jgi:hypothetical protein